jgi:hypothetical protein
MGSKWGSSILLGPAGSARVRWLGNASAPRTQGQVTSASDSGRGWRNVGEPSAVLEAPPLRSDSPAPVPLRSAAPLEELPRARVLGLLWAGRTRVVADRTAAGWRTRWPCPVSRRVLTAPARSRGAFPGTALVQPQPPATVPIRVWRSSQLPFQSNSPGDPHPTAVAKHN